MRLLTHIVSPEQEGWPLRRLLRQELRISGSFLSRLKWRPGAILVNGRPATVAAVLHTGDAVTADVSDLPGTIPISGRWPGPWTSCGRMRTCWC